MTAHVLTGAADIDEGQRTLVSVQGREVGLFRVSGRIVAIVNVCPHRGAPVCRGQVTGTALPSPPGEYRWGREGEVLRCPWHGWEFDLLNGESLFDPRVRVKMLRVEERGKDVVVWV